MNCVASLLQLFLWVHWLLSAQAFVWKRSFAAQRLFIGQFNGWSAASKDEENSAEKNKEDRESPLHRFQGCSDVVASRRGFLVVSSCTIGLGSFSRHLSLSSSPTFGSTEIIPFSTVRRYKSVQLSNGMSCVLVRSSMLVSAFR